MFPVLKSVAVVSVLTLAGSTIAGCYVRASTQPEPYSVTEVSSAPVSIETYPHTTYEGSEVYLYNDRWYYRDHHRGNRWVYYQNPPPALERQRPYVQQAPPARRYEAPRPVAPVAPAAPPPQSAPPAVRVQ